MFWRKRKPGDFGDEIEADLQLEVDRLRNDGLSEEDARLAARRRFGNVTSAEERFYEAAARPGRTFYGRTSALACGCWCGTPAPRRWRLPPWPSASAAIRRSSAC